MIRLSFTEFIEWIEYLRLKERRNSKHDLYLAQIAAEVRRGYVVSPRNVKVADFLLGEDHQGKEKMKNSKKIWAAALGVNLGKN